jgi:hypothetical protein
MDLRAWLAGVLGDLSDRLSDGRDPDAYYDPGAPVYNDPPSPLISGYTPAVQADYRFDAWRAQVQQRAMRFGPWLAAAAALILVFGLVRFWQFVAQRPGNAQASAQAQAQEVAKKFEAAYRLDQVKHELAGSDSAPAGPPAPSSTPIGGSTGAAPLIHFFPPGAQPMWYPTFSMQPRASSRSRGNQEIVVSDPLAMLVRQYADQLRAAQQAKSEDHGDLPMNGGTPLLNSRIGRG